MTRERAWKLVERFPIGSTIYPTYRTMKGKKYGPYYEARFAADGREQARYIGGERERRELEAAWSLVRDELAAAEGAAEGASQVKKLRELEARAGLARTRGVVSVPILDAKEVASSSRPK